MSDKTIKAPLPGTFYRQSDPNSDPFVTEGDKVKPGDVVGLVEIMKSFHEVKSEDSGVVERFLVENEDTVEAGQDLAVLGG
ncbi:MAG: biotin carboxyl carrier domain-containing protein [Solirubrobacterales bacterium]|nr:biotin carboxyl carrier domain-containing protein [Solirubrobacterales bacterium]